MLTDVVGPLRRVSVTFLLDPPRESLVAARRPSPSLVLIVTLAWNLCDYVKPCKGARVAQAIWRANETGNGAPRAFSQI
jgi:hypothetical protein